MVKRLTRLLIRCGVTWFPKKLAEKLVAHDVVIVTRCEDCPYCKEVNSPQGTVWYCNAFDKKTSSAGYCHNSEGWG